MMMMRMCISASVNKYILHIQRGWDADDGKGGLGLFNTAILMIRHTLIIF